MRLYGQIEKVQPQDDGTLLVHGIASTEDVDSAGEIVRAEAMRAALPDYMKFPAIREMHQLSAAGSAVEAEVGEDGITRIVAHVVDSGAISKVKNNVYRGFSIGGKVTKRNADNRKIIEGVSLSEISLVDRPANPSSVLEMWKADQSDETETDKEAATDAEDNDSDVEVEKAAATEIEPSEEGEETTVEPEIEDTVVVKLADGTEFHIEPDSSIRIKKRKFNAKDRKKDAKTGEAEADGCLSGDTPVITRDGVRLISDLEGESVDILTMDGASSGVGRWQRAYVASYGFKRVRGITLSCCGSSFTVKASLGHRWILSDGKEIFTRDLVEGDKAAFVLSPDAIPALYRNGAAAHVTALATPDHRQLYGAIDGYGDATTRRRDRRAEMQEVCEGAPPNRILPIHRVQGAQDHPVAYLQRVRTVEDEQEVPGPAAPKPASPKRGGDEDLLSLPRDAANNLLLLEKEGRSLSARLPEVRECARAAIHDVSPREGKSEGQERQDQDIRPVEAGLRVDGGETARHLRNLRTARAGLQADSIVSGPLPQDFGRSWSSLPQLQYASGLGRQSRFGEDSNLPSWVVTNIGHTQEEEEVFCATVPETGSFVIGPGLLTGNSFPIANKQDLRNAIRAYGRSKNKAATKRHIIARARALGASDLIPDDWKDTKKVTVTADAETGDQLAKAGEPAAPISPSAVGDVMGDGAGNADSQTPGAPVAGARVMANFPPGGSPADHEAVNTPNAATAGNDGQDKLDTSDTPIVEHVAPEAPVAGTDTRTHVHPEGNKADAVDPISAAREAAEKALKSATESVEKATAAVGGSPIPAPLRAGAELRKSLGTVARLGYLLSELAYILSDVRYEAEYEADDSTVPEQLRAAIAPLAAVYRAMSEEEISELMASVDAKTASALAAAVSGGDAMKAFAVIADPEAIAKLSPLDEQLAKRDTEIAGLKGNVEALLKLNGDLTSGLDLITKRMDELAAMPMPAKTLTAAAPLETVIKAVTKEEDTAGITKADASTVSPAISMTSEDFQKAWDALPAETRADMSLRASLQRPIPISR
jgi:hypothetical protein